MAVCGIVLEKLVFSFFLDLDGWIFFSVEGLHAVEDSFLKKVLDFSQQRDLEVLPLSKITLQFINKRIRKQLPEL